MLLYKIYSNGVHICFCFVGVARFFQLFSWKTLALASDTNFVSRFTITVHLTHPWDTFKLLGERPRSAFFVIILVWLQMFFEGSRVDGHMKQCTHHDIFSQVSRGGLGSRVKSKLPSLKCMGKFHTLIISESVSPKAKRNKNSYQLSPYAGDHQCMGHGMCAC